MKKALGLTVALLITLAAYGAGLPLNFSKEFKYEPYTMNGLNFMVHSSLSDDEKEMTRAMEYMVKIFASVEKTIPKTTREFQKQKGKIFLYELDFGGGGMEYVRKDQHKWDSRFNSTTDNCIIIVKAYSYSKTGHNGFAYLLHEMIHFHHLNILKSTYDAEIKNSYRLALNNPNYRGVYASSNYLEYFAEISTAYLLESHRTSRFPKGSKELYIHDRTGYNLCKKIWGGDLAAYKPATARPVAPAPAAPPIPQIVRIGNPYGYRPTPNPKHNSHCRCTKCSAGHSTRLFKMPTDEEVLISKKFIEIMRALENARIEGYKGNDAISGWLYSNALSMLEDFKEKHPSHRVNVINRLIISTKTKIN
jgi:hypothetical protein